jgi:hypothetical protein
VELVEQDNVGYHGAFYFDMMETLLKRLVLGLANDLGKSGITAVAVAPGFMRTEAILEGFGVTEANWRDALSNPQAAADADVARKNGGIYTTRALSEEYGFNDIDGTRPDYAVFDAAIEQAKKTFLAPSIDATRFTSVDWKLASKMAAVHAALQLWPVRVNPRSRGMSHAVVSASVCGGRDHCGGVSGSGLRSHGGDAGWRRPVQRGGSQAPGRYQCRWRPGTGWAASRDGPSAVLHRQLGELPGAL